MTNSARAETSSLLLEDVSPMQFFHDKVVEAQERQSVKLPEDVEFYIVNLLCDFVRFNADTQSDCLALTLKKALESSYGEQIMLYKHLGDTALYFAGFFQEYFASKSFDVGYYVMMGESAYGTLSTMMRRRGTYEATMSKIYGELAKGFVSAVDIILDVSEHTTEARPIDRTTLSVYDAWLSTASAKLESELRNRGVMPVRVRRRTVQ